MASLPAHCIVGAGLALAEAPRWRVLAIAAAIAVAPDLDALSMIALRIPYNSYFGHRGFFHSPFFLVTAAIVSAYLLMQPAWRGPAIVWGLAGLSHPFLDALTDGGHGVMLLAPFSSARYFLPWRPIVVSPLGLSDFVDEAGFIFSFEWPFAAGAVAFGLLALAMRRWVLPRY